MGEAVPLLSRILEPERRDKKGPKKEVRPFQHTLVLLQAVSHHHHKALAFARARRPAPNERRSGLPVDVGTARPRASWADSEAESSSLVHQ